MEDTSPNFWLPRFFSAPTQLIFFNSIQFSATSAPRRASKFFSSLHSCAIPGTEIWCEFRSFSLNRSFCDSCRGFDQLAHSRRVTTGTFHSTGIFTPAMCFPGYGPQARIQYARGAGANVREPYTYCANVDSSYWPKYLNKFTSNDINKITAVHRSPV